ncbi:hypothetical protein ACX0HA_04590 [Flavobacterium hauense]
MKYFSLLLLMLLSASGYSQADTIKTQYNDMVIANDRVYAIADKGKISVWDIHSLKKLHEAQDTMYSAIAKDRNNVIHIGTKDGRIAKLNNDFSLDCYLQLKKKLQVHNIFFNSQNKMFLAVPYAVYDPVKDKFWNEFKIIPTGMTVSTIKKFLFFTYLRPAKYNFMLPRIAFTDSNDRIWMGNSFGEFGTMLNVFDAKKEKELEPDLFESYGSLYLQSVFEDDKKNVFITSGLQHFMNFGEIYKIVNGKAVSIFNTGDYNEKEEKGNLFIGPGAFSTKEQKLYFATQNGIYRAAVSHESKITELEKVFSPELFYSRENLAIGAQMAVIKMEFTSDNRLIFLTSNNGIQVYNGKEVVVVE